MGSWLTIAGAIAAVAGAAVAKLLADELKEVIIWLRKRILLLAKARLPFQVRSRFSEEWDSDIDRKPGELAKLVWAVGCYTSTAEIQNIFASGSREISSFASQRAMSILLSQVSIVFLAPLLIFACLALWISGPALTTTSRVGQRGRQFRLIKFRSVEANDKGVAVAHFLRRASLDELPQLFNVLRGDINLIGPRPRTETQLQRLREDHREIYLRVKPGLVPPNILLNDDNREAQEHFDFEYCLRRTILVDMKILLRTVWVVFTGSCSLKP